MKRLLSTLSLGLLLTGSAQGMAKIDVTYATPNLQTFQDQVGVVAKAGWNFIKESAYLWKDHPGSVFMSALAAYSICKEWVDYAKTPTTTVESVTTSEIVTKNSSVFTKMKSKFTPGLWDKVKRLKYTLSATAVVATWAGTYAWDACTGSTVAQ